MDYRRNNFNRINFGTGFGINFSLMYKFQQPTELIVYILYCTRLILFRYDRLCLF